MEGGIEKKSLEIYRTCKLEIKVGEVAIQNTLEGASPESRGVYRFLYPPFRNTLSCCSSVQFREIVRKRESRRERGREIEIDR